jgi:hypothetical protein
MMKDEPEVRLESRVEQKGQRVEMRIYGEIWTQGW